MPLQTNGIYPCLVIPKPRQPLVPGHPNISSRVVGSLPIWRCPKMVVPPNHPSHECQLDHFSVETHGFCTPHLSSNVAGNHEGGLIFCLEIQICRFLLLKGVENSGEKYLAGSIVKFWLCASPRIQVNPKGSKRIRNR